MLPSAKTISALEFEDTRNIFGETFCSNEKRLLWHDALPYLELSRATERRLGADLTVAGLPARVDPAISRALAQADALAAQSSPGPRSLECMRSV